MAGIGFELKRLFADKSIYGYSKAFSYTLTVTLGPFVLMVSMVLIVQLLLRYLIGSYYLSELYTVSIIYPFIFSHILSSGFVMVVTRYISDKLYEKAYADILPSLYGCLAVLLPCAFLLGIAFLYFVQLSLAVRALTLVFFLQMVMLWVFGVYLSALKDFLRIVQCYALGIFCGCLLASLAIIYGLPHLLALILLSINLGILLINLALLSQIRAFFSQNSRRYFSFLPYFDIYGRLFGINFFYTLAVYVANFIFWRSSFSQTLAGAYVYAPEYDLATFLAFLSAMGAMVMFVVSTETEFYEKYSNYFGFITEKGNALDIQSAKKEMIDLMWQKISNIAEFQLIITCLCIICGNYFLPSFGISYNTVIIFDLIACGTYACAIFQVLLILLVYFEDRTGAFWLALLYCTLNIVFNIISLFVGTNSFGFGFFAASFIVLVLAVEHLERFMRAIDYHVFCNRPIYYRPYEGIFTYCYKKFFAKEVAKCEKPS